MSRIACHRNLKRFASKKIKARYNLDLFKGKLVSVIERFEKEELKFMFRSVERKIYVSQRAIEENGITQQFFTVT